jgi:hypothetical protein
MHDPQWDGPIETSGGSRGRGGCAAIFILAGIAALALRFPWFGLPLLVVIGILWFMKRPR